MRQLRIALMSGLVAVWLLATQHCGLEAVGLLAEGCEQTDGQHNCSTTEHAADGCHIVESASYKTSNATVKVSAPQLIACLCLICVDAVNTVLAQTVESPAWQHAGRPRDWVPSVAFVQRTAPSPRAPSLV